MHKLNNDRFYDALKKRGYASVSAFAKSLGIHRNTIHYYLSGHGVFPTSLDAIFAALDLDLEDIIVSEEEGLSPLEGVAPIVDRLHVEFPEVTFILFGSRAQGRAAKYSDWDLGVFSKGGISHEIYRKIRRRAGELAENLPFMIDVVNLARADNEFLREISKGWMFLTGRLDDWLALGRKAKHEEKN